MTDASSPASDVFGALVVRHGHHRLESGLHAATWLELDALLLDPRALQPRIDELAALLRPYRPSAICGPLTGGAFIAHAVACAMQVRFYYTQRAASPSVDDLPRSLFGAVYALPEALETHASGERFAVVDDVISAGSSVRATIDALAATGASIAAVGALLVLGDRAVDHFAAASMPLVAGRFARFDSWEPDRCPLCAAGVPFGTQD